MEALEAVLANVSLFEHLRADEIGRIARRFGRLTMKHGDRRPMGATMEDARLFVVVSGRVALVRGDQATVLEPGDRYGELSLVSGHTRPYELVAERDALVATLDRDGLDALLVEFPAVALPLADEVSRELHARNDAVRQILELHAERLPPEQLADAIDERRHALARRGARVARLSSRALFHRLVAQEGGEPPFWMLTGFIVSLGGARLVVHLILKYHLEKQLFALVQGTDPNPMHVHHFNYGMILIGCAGLAALFPLGRRALRALAFVFGAGCGLVFDEFSLIWNLNPEYAKASSLIASGFAIAVLLQLTYFRRYWGALARRAWNGVRR